MSSIMAVPHITSEKASATDEISEYVNSYVQDGLVSLYSGKYNTKEGHSVDTSSWDNLVGSNSINLVINANNGFVNDSFHNKSTKQYFTDLEKNTINGSAYSIEFVISDFSPVAYDNNYLISSTNENFVLLKRRNDDSLECKYGGLASSFHAVVSDATRILSSSIISITSKTSGQIKVYVNGELKVEKNCITNNVVTDLFFGHNDSSKASEAKYKTFRFYNRELTAAEVKANALVDNKYIDDETVYFNDVELGDSNIIGGLNSIRRIESYAEINEVVHLTHLPQAVIYKLDKDLKVVLDDKNDVAINDAIKVAPGKIIPVFDVDSEETVNNLSECLKQMQYFDCFVLSKNPELVKAMRKLIPEVYGVIDYSDRFKDKESLSKEEMVAIRKEMHTNYGTVAILPIELCSKVNVQYLFDSIVNVWALDTKNDEVSLFQGIVSGAIGVVTDQSARLYDIAKNSFFANSMTRMPLNIAHRGLPGIEGDRVAPENTIESAREAYAAGADVIELDIYLTTDNKVVVMHDNSTERTCNESVTVENCTFEQLKSLYVNKGFENHEKYSECRIPTFEEYLKEFKGKDIRLFVEIKSYKEAIVPAAKALIEQYDMYDQISFITFTANQLANLNKYYPEATGGLLCNGILDDTNSQEDMLSVMKTIGKYNATLNPDKSGYGKRALLAALSRGISVYPWTFNSSKEYEMYFLNGYCGLTGNDCRKLGNYAKTFEYEKENETCIDYYTESYYKTINYNKAKSKYVKKGLVIPIGSNLEVVDGGLHGKVEGKEYAVLGCEVETDSGEKYVIYSDVVTVNVVDKHFSIDDTMMSESNLKVVVPIVAVSVIATAGIGIGAFLIIKGKKRAKSE